MKRTILSGLALMVLAAPVAAMAQPATNWQTNRGWDRDSFWRGAAADPRQRMDFLQQRIDRGVSDGSLTRKEARNSQKELNRIRRDARNMGRINDREAASLNSRLDNLAQKIRWRRTDNDYGAGTGPRGSDYDRRFATDYDASRYYRDDPRYQERRLSGQDEV